MPRPKNFEPFLSPEQLGHKVDEWKEGGKGEKTGIYSVGAPFIYGRIEEHRPDSVSQLHGVSFLHEVIPSYIKNKKENQKVKILDNGGGGGVFAEQIRSTFGDRVEVMTTGLVKK